MSTADLAELRERYLNILGHEGVSSEVIAEIENRLGVSLPNDLKEVASFYRGGVLGGISHHAFEIGAADNITGETLRIRSAIALPDRYAVLAEPPESIIVLNCKALAEPAVIWCDAHELGKLSTTESLTAPDLWQSYAEFFSYLLDKEQTEAF